MFKKGILYTVVVMLILASINGFSQSNKILLLRDSNDFKEKALNINSNYNEFSPLIYKGGLMYVSDKPLEGAKASFNKIYWTEDVHFKIVDKEKVVLQNRNAYSKYYDFSPKNHDFTPATSNDNDILFNYKKVKNNFNQVEVNFKNFSTNQAFAYDEKNNIIIYSKESAIKHNKKKRWELWEAKIVDAKIIHKRKIVFKDKNADYLYPNLSEDGNTLYFSSNINGGAGGYDIYFISKVNNIWNVTLQSFDEPINSKQDDLSPFYTNDTLYFSSNRDGGIGGFDIYYSVPKTKSNVTNLGYPINSEKDEVSLRKLSQNQFYLTTNRNVNYDILSLQYSPIVYNLYGQLRYKQDSSLAVNHQMVITDKLTNEVIDTIFTDHLARYAFKGKPNRDYQFVTLNGDSAKEYLSITTLSGQSNFYYPLAINGRSPRQVIDSLDYIAKLNKEKHDSIALMNVNNKFIVYYGFDKFVLSKFEIRVLDSLLSRLKRDTKLNVVIGAFTDCIGSFKYNTILSNKRANSVVAYLTKNGLSKSRIISNGYSKNYTIIPCAVSKKMYGQKLNRRAEIVLSESKNNDWASLEKSRGSTFYSIYTSDNKVKPLIAVKIPIIVKKDTKAKVVKPVVVMKKDTIVKVIPIVVKKETIAKVVKPIVVTKKDTIVKVVSPVANKDTIARVIKPVAVVKKDTIVKVIPIVFKKDTIAKVVKPVVVTKKDTIVKVISPVMKKDSLAKVIPALVKKDSIVKVIPPVVKKDTLAKLVKPVVVVKKDTIVKVIPPVVKKDTIVKVVKPAPVKLVLDSTKINTAKVNVNNVNTASGPMIDRSATIVAKEKKELKIETKQPEQKIIVANTSDYNDEMAKEDILKALDSLAKLKREQERIIEYLTKRINKKPIDVFVSSDSVSIDIYDNGIHDNDSVSVIYNNRIVVDKQLLKVNKPISFKLKVDKNKKYNELVMVAENLGSEPPNTAVMFVTEKSGRRQQVMLNTDMTHNEVVYFIRIGKE